MALRRGWFILLAAALLVLPSCGDRDSGGRNMDVVEGQARKSNRDIKVPREIVQDIERWFIDSERHRDPTRAGTDLEVLGTLKRQLLNLQVQLTPKSGNALESGIRFNLPTGGGTIDLADYVHGQRGGFRVKMKLAEKIEGLSGMKVFFLSESRRRTVLGEELGSGCGKLAEMSTWFAREHGQLDVYMADQRYASVLAGTWLLAAVAKNELHLGTVTFTDSRYPFLLCESEAL